MMYAQIPEIVALGTSVVLFWFTTLAVIEQKRILVFTPFFIGFSFVCFIAAGLFTNLNFTLTSGVEYAFSLVIGVFYIGILWRENRDK